MDPLGESTSREGGKPAASPDGIDRGLAEAFGAPIAEAPASSVLAALQARVGSVLGVHLDAQDADETPVAVTEAAKRLRDPSGRYQVLGEIGRGGVGVVYKGRDTDLGRDVAMKVLKEEYARRADVLARFVEEAQIGGQLQHPGIVPVYELGLQAGERPYFAMKLVKGETLAAQLARRSTAAEDRRRLLGIFEQVCQTLAYAHARRVVHRDLKPANVMIGAFGEVQVVDWGFAKVLPKGGVADERESAARASERSVIETVRSGPGSHSRPGSMLGTPAYMSPEQASGDVERVDRRSDVFGLGAILCEILTGVPPYREEDGDLVRQAAGGELDGAHERLGACGADPSLVALSTECLARAPRARPESAAEVAERVGAYLTSVEERARDAELRAAEARYKQRTTLVSAAAGLLILALAAGAWLWIDGEAKARRAEATQRVATALSAASGARGQAQAAGIDLALWASAESSAAHALSLARPSDVDPAARAEAEALLAAVEDERRAARSEAERQERDATMLARLERLRIPIDDDVRARSWDERESRRLDAEYADAFAEYLGGTSLLESSTEAALASMRRGDIEVELAASLDHWGLVRDGLGDAKHPPDFEGTVRIREAARLLDPEDGWRSRLRGYLSSVTAEPERLVALAEEADFASLPAAACRVLGEALWRAGDKEGAVLALHRAREVHPQDFDLCFRLAVCLELLDEPRWQEAVDTYRIAHALRPDHGEVLHRQGLALERLRHYDGAERIFRRLAEREPANSHWLRHVAIVLRKRGELEQALEIAGRALEIDPGDHDTHHTIGNLLKAQGRLEEGLEHLFLALELRPEAADVHSDAGNVLVRLGRFDEALEHHGRAVQLDPHDWRFHNNLANLALQAGRLDDALESARRAIAIHPRGAQAIDTLGCVLRSRGRAEEALDHHRRALHIDPLESRFHASLGTTLSEVGRFEEAVESYRRALELEPGNWHACMNLGRTLALLGRFDEAVETSRRAVELAPGSPLTHYNLAHVLELRGSPDEALEAFQRADELFAPMNTDLARELGSVARWRVQQIRRLPDLQDVLVGARVAASAAEWHDAVLMGYQAKRYREIVALTERTLESSIDFAGEDSWGLYNSACAAARLAAESAESAERSRALELANAWLASELERWLAWTGEDGPRAEEGRRRLQHALEDPDFDAVRGDALAELPAPEQAAWHALWSAVEQAHEEAR